MSQYRDLQLLTDQWTSLDFKLQYIQRRGDCTAAIIYFGMIHDLDSDKLHGISG
jgi:hypothetical protein